MSVETSVTGFAISPDTSRPLWLAAGLSMLLHVAFVGTTTLELDRLLDRVPPPEPTAIEVVSLPAPEPAPIPEPQPRPTEREQHRFVLPPPPQLEEAPIGLRSTHSGEVPAPATPAPPQTVEPAEEASEAKTGAPPPPPAPTPQARRSRQAQTANKQAAVNPIPLRLDAPTLMDRSAPSVGAAPRRGGSAPSREQSEGDFVLAQIMPHWKIDKRNARYRNVLLGGTFFLQADGMLRAPFGRNDPWNPERMIENYRLLQSGHDEAVREALESFLRAARAAQPFRLPPGAGGDYPRPIRIVFTMGDL
ncbi:MAG: hypothetical protein FJX57_06170 [Alphaproteobacteria bacterium]|nr:hypothetical protein [Alphaproteobacteria bacterium]